MRQSASTLDSFYTSRMGQICSDLIGQRLFDLWGPCQGLRMLGLGYPAPLLANWQTSARTCIGAVPEAYGQTSMHQTHGQAFCTVSEARLPFRESVFDRIILTHALEEAENPRHLLRECWRILAPEGRLLVATTNRKSLWSLDESKPFGHGRPWTRGQLSRFLNNSLFQVTASTTAMHLPPLNWPLITAAANSWERAGEALLPGLGGVVLVEAIKHLHARPGGNAAAPASPALRPQRNRKALPNNMADTEAN